MTQYRELFPFFQHSSSIYLDSAATSQRLRSVIEQQQDYYHTSNASVHRTSYALAQSATKAYEHSRASVARLINADKPDNIVFTSGATESLNLIALGLQTQHLTGNKILLCRSEHHANILPWQRFAKQHNYQLEVVNLSTNASYGENQLSATLAQLNDDVAVLAMAHVSNALGNIYPVAELIAAAKPYNILSVIDGTQAIAHLSVDVQALDCDFYVFSGHKMYGPTGVGICYGKSHRLEQLLPYKLGGEMISSVSFEQYQYAPVPYRFEGGTPNIAGVIGLAPACEFLQQQGEQIFQHEQSLYQYLIDALQKFKGLRLWGNVEESIATLAFTIYDVNTDDLAALLYQQNIAIRAGHHCAMPLLQSLQLDGLLRVSLACYNQKTDIDAFVLALAKALELLQAHDNGVQTNSNYTDDLATIRHARDWAEMSRQLMLLSKSLPSLPIEQRIPAHKVAGCEHQLWLWISPEQKVYAYSESKLIRGILFVLLQQANKLTTEARKQFDFAAFLQELGVTKYFSQGRQNGINNAIALIQRG